MRPSILFPLFAPVTTLSGIGPRLAAFFEKLCGPSLVHLLWHLPTGFHDRRWRPKIVESVEGAIVTLTVTVESHHPSVNRRQPYRVRCVDDTGTVDATYFHATEAYLRRLFPIGKKIAMSGRVERFNGRLQMPHPDYVVSVEEVDRIAIVEPTYSLIGGLTQKILRKAVGAALSKLPLLPEWIDSAWIKSQRLPAWKEALKLVHFPQSQADLSPLSPARRRLAYDEMLAHQLALALVRHRQKSVPGRSIQGDGKLRAHVLTALPYRLTSCQEKALQDIFADMVQSTGMLRLLQGDVGSGKTIVALLTLLNAVECGYQAALMAPTEILARQHVETIEPLLKDMGIRVQILTGREKGTARSAILKDLASGAISIAIGTHALFQDAVVFHSLGVVVIDEQHRFGVHQRLQLSSKGAMNPGYSTDVLVMTATPIPRTLALSVYGDMDVSRLTEKPPGRKPIDTRSISSDRLSEVVEGLQRAIDQGSQAYWVCPLVDESEAVDLAAATDRHAALVHIFGDRVGLVHGQMKAADKDKAMEAFREGRTKILVATTVIEVGVHVPMATIMVIEHAERFGLAQLHQLRGRVGRGEKPSTCILLYASPLGEVAKNRIRIMRETEDGFRIAEEDLRLRGAGDVLGARQSGLPELRLGDFALHGDLLHTADQDAKLILTQDPLLQSERGKALRVLLYLFEKDASIRYVRSG